MAMMTSGDTLQVCADSDQNGGRFLLLAGDPINEPIARHGPFVMNTDDEIQTAIRDYQSGRMGESKRL